MGKLMRTQLGGVRGTNTTHKHNTTHTHTNAQPPTHTHTQGCTYTPPPPHPSREHRHCTAALVNSTVYCSRLPPSHCIDCATFLSHTVLYSVVLSLPLSHSSLFCRSLSPSLSQFSIRPLCTRAHSLTHTHTI